jgi:hypothetical protein
MPKITAIVSRTCNQLSLVQGHDYEVIEVDEDCFRVIDESGEPALYPKTFFLDCDFAPPTDWLTHDYGGGQYTISPPEFSSAGFFEDYDDQVPAAVETYRDYVRRLATMNHGSR